MKRRWALLLLLTVATLVVPVAGCGGDGEESPFEGDWVSATAPRLSFEGSSWSDGEGDSGDFTYAGEYPVFTIAFTSASRTVERQATFADERTFELCAIGAGGALFDCHDYVLDRPTIH